MLVREGTTADELNKIKLNAEEKLKGTKGVVKIASIIRTSYRYGFRL